MNAFAVWCIACADQFLKPKFLEILSKVFSEITPLWIITGKEHCLVLEDFWIEGKISVDLFFYVVVLSIKLIIFVFSCTAEFVYRHVGMVVQYAAPRGDQSGKGTVAPLDTTIVPF